MLNINYDQAKHNRDIGIEQSADTSGDAWLDYAKAFLWDYLRTHEKMHVDSLWLAGLEVPKSPRALGAVVTHAKRNGWMEYITTDEGIVAKPSTASNLALRAVWRSRLYGEQENV